MHLPPRRESSSRQWSIPHQSTTKQFVQGYPSAAARCTQHVRHSIKNPPCAHYLQLSDSPRDNFLIQSDRRNMSHISGQTIGSSKCLSSFQLPAGTYEFPFSISLPHRMLETVTTQEHAYHTYHVQAIIERRFKADSIISQPIRIYNHPDLLADHRLLSSPVSSANPNQ